MRQINFLKSCLASYSPQHYHHHHRIYTFKKVDRQYMDLKEKLHLAPNIHGTWKGSHKNFHRVGWERRMNGFAPSQVTLITYFAVDEKSESFFFAKFIHK